MSVFPAADAAGDSVKDEQGVNSSGLFVSNPLPNITALCVMRGESKKIPGDACMNLHTAVS